MSVSGVGSRASSTQSLIVSSLVLQRRVISAFDPWLNAYLKRLTKPVLILGYLFTGKML
jgi:hypothetical protein